MPKYVCDCGAVYNDLVALELCLISNHGEGIRVMPDERTRLATENVDLRQLVDSLSKELRSCDGLLTAINNLFKECKADNIAKPAYGYWIKKIDTRRRLQEPWLTMARELHLS